MARFRFVVPVLVLALLFFATPASAVRSTRIHLPGSGYQVKYYCFSKYCPQGTPCEQGTLTAGTDSTVSVPQLLYIGGGTYTYFNQVNIQFVPENGAAHIVDQGDLAPMLVLRPAENVADRALDFTPACNPYWVEMLEERRVNQEFFVVRYGIWTGSITIELETDPEKGPSFGTGNNHLYMPADPAWFDYSQHPSLTYTIGHEMTHYVQTLAGNPVGEGITHYHDGCMSASVEASFGEGLAGAIGREFSSWRTGHDPDEDITPCWKLTYWYTKADVVGPNFEDNQAAFIRSLTKRDRRAFWHIFTTAKVVVVTGEQRPIRDCYELLMAMTGRKILSDRWVVNPDTTSFPKADSLFQYWINGKEPAVLALNTDSNNAGGWEHEKHFWMRRVYPNPVRGPFYIDARAPSSGTIQIDLYDVRGRRVHTQAFTGLAIGEYRITITPPRLASGVYFIRYSDQAGLATDSDRVAIVQ